MLANRLKRVVSKLVSDFRHAFVEGRQILNAALIANETIDSRLKNSTLGIICKLNIEMAYDHVNWSFQLAVIKKMGFEQKREGWMKWCIFLASFLVLVNGTPIDFFQSSRGLRQGGPFLSLFICSCNGGLESISC